MILSVNFGPRLFIIGLFVLAYICIFLRVRWQEKEIKALDEIARMGHMSLYNQYMLQRPTKRSRTQKYLHEVNNEGKL
jgi:hypothetical protein